MAMGKNWLEKFCFILSVGSQLQIAFDGAAKSRDDEFIGYCLNFNHSCLAREARLGPELQFVQWSPTFGACLSELA
jgi:hypothetical protein